LLCFALIEGSFYIEINWVWNLGRDGDAVSTQIYHLNSHEPHYS